MATNRGQSREAQESCQRICELHCRQSSEHSELRRSAAAWGTNCEFLCGVGGQSGGEQTDGKKATNEVERARRPFALASTHTGIEWRPPPVVRSLAPRYGRRSRTRATG